MYCEYGRIKLSKASRPFFQPLHRLKTLAGPNHIGASLSTSEIQMTRENLKWGDGETGG